MEGDEVAILAAALLGLLVGGMVVVVLGG